MNIEILGDNRKLRRRMPYIGVTAVALILAASVLTSNAGSESSFAFSVNWPAPSSYAPGDTPPNVYLQINYTGSGMGNFTYSIYYNSTAGSRVVSHGTVLVSKLSPFTAYATIPVTPEGGVTATGVVYSNYRSGSDLVFTKSISL